MTFCRALCRKETERLLKHIEYLPTVMLLRAPVARRGLDFCHCSPPLRLVSQLGPALLCESPMIQNELTRIPQMTCTKGF